MTDNSKITRDELDAITALFAARNAEIERLNKELLERDAIWLPEKDAEIDRRAAEIERLVAALDTAIELAQEGISYTAEYFVGKWRMQERCDELKAIARAARSNQKESN